MTTRRTLSDHLAIRGEHNTIWLAKAIVQQWGMDGHTEPPSVDDALEVLERNPGLHEIATSMQREAAHKRQLSSD